MVQFNEMFFCFKPKNVKNKYSKKLISFHLLEALFAIKSKMSRLA
jgi:hypothetical protein